MLEVQFCIQPNSPIIILILLTFFHKFAMSIGAKHQCHVLPKETQITDGIEWTPPPPLWILPLFKVNTIPPPPRNGLSKFFSKKACMTCNTCMTCITCILFILHQSMSHIIRISHYPFYSSPKTDKLCKAVLTTSLIDFWLTTPIKLDRHSIHPGGS